MRIGILVVVRLCPTCHAAPLGEITEGVYRCMGCRLTPNACVCRRAVYGGLDNFQEGTGS
jgi:hypothetical protein